jgi:hypothetical protein
MMQKHPTNYWIYESSDNLNTLIRQLNGYLLSSAKPILGFLLMSKFDIFEIIKSYQTDKNTEYSIREMKKNENILSFNLRRIIHGSQRKIEGKAIVTKTDVDNIYLVVSDGSFEFLDLGLRRFFELNYPEISLVSFSSMHLKNTLSSLADRRKGEIMTDKTVAYRRSTGLNHVKGLEGSKRRTSQVTYTNEIYTKVFKEAAENNLWIDKIVFTLIEEEYEKKKSTLHAYISRQSIFKCWSNFNTFYSDVLKNMIDISRNLFVLYKDRGRMQKNRTITSKPLSIKYGFPIFDSIEQNRKLIETLEKMTYLSISVLHSNPYLHISLLDFLDGSSYDIKVLADDEIIVIPQLRASYASINRLFDHIFKFFGEGVIENFVVKDVNRKNN